MLATKRQKKLVEYFFFITTNIFFSTFGRTGDENCLVAMEGRVFKVMNEQLTKELTMEEVSDAVLQMSRLKSQRLDGLSVCFY